MKTITYDNNKIIETREAVGTEWVIRDGQGVETGREPLTTEELAQLADEGKATPDEKFAADVAAATTVAGLKAAILARFGG